MKSILVTGATQGLGLKIVSRLAADSDTEVFMAVRNVQKGLEIAHRLGPNVFVVPLDLTRLSEIGRFIKMWNRDLDALVNNAGVQFHTADHFTSEGFEETITVNYLAAFMLTIGLEKHLTGGRVLFIGSGTHDPNYVNAKLFGFRGAQYTSVKDLAAGASTSGDPVQRNLDRYATSKFLISSLAVEIARRNRTSEVFVLDPGLMPGTGLARSRNSISRFLWKRVMPLAKYLLPDTSSTRKSSAAAYWLLKQPRFSLPSGTIYSYTRKPCRYVWNTMVKNPIVGREIYEQSSQIVRPYLEKSRV